VFDTDTKFSPFSHGGSIRAAIEDAP